MADLLLDSLRRLLQAVKLKLDEVNERMLEETDLQKNRKFAEQATLLGALQRQLVDLVAVAEYPTLESIEDALGRDFVSEFGSNIERLETYTIRDSNFATLAGIAGALGGAVKEIRGLS